MGQVGQLGGGVHGGSRGRTSAGACARVGRAAGGMRLILVRPARNENIQSAQTGLTV
ncbi:uncharacterized protein AruCF_4439 [Achromobacter ruhlandii]|nr:uncharacterized protein AruCF_4439 [Achromobacter ruhlandii]